jgi:Zn-dependent protease
MTVNTGRISGIQISLDYSWFLIFALLTWSLANNYLPSQYPEQSASFYWGVGLAASITLFISILIHEVAHSIVAQRNGMEIKSITLHFFGGVSEMTEEAETPGSELQMAAVGPLISFLLGFLFLGIWWGLGTGLPLYFSAIFQYASYANIVLAVFNSIPAFPMDGGRVLRALLWKRSGKILLATRISTKVSKVISFLFIGFGVFSLFVFSTLNGLWFLVLGFIISGNATASLNQTILSESLGDVKVFEIMTENVTTVNPDFTIQQFVDRFLNSLNHHGYPVVEDGKVLGLICEHDIKEVEMEYWDEQRVEEVMTPSDDLHTVEPEDNAADALMNMARNDVGRLPVIKDGKLVGIITRSDVNTAVRIRNEKVEKVIRS